MKNLYLVIMMVLAAAAAHAQTMSSHITVSVTAPETEDLDGQYVSIMHNMYGVTYANTVLNAEGRLTVDVYPGEHTVSVAREGYLPDSTVIDVADGATAEVTLTLTEDVQAPRALTAEYEHNVFTGHGTISLTWNMEPDVFFDDFESYEPWAIEFGEWTGFDLDGDEAAKLAGSYPNQSERQYCTIVNPLTVEPTWWYDYPILRPFSGQQYAGFIRTNTGVANNDWLITPAVTPGHANIFEFLVRAADVYNEKFQVYLTTKTDNPTPDDFIKISGDNYETATYKGWRRCTYDLSAYEGVPVKLAIRYMSSANNGGAFMLMVDNVRVGNDINPYEARSRRAPQMSPANPNETFLITLDGTEVGTTDEYTYEIADVAPGQHTVGVKSVYRDVQSEEVTINLDIPTDTYCDMTFAITHPADLPEPMGKIVLTDLATGKGVTSEFNPGLEARFPSVPYGQYTIEIEAAPGYAKTAERISIDTPTLQYAVNLAENIVDPMNLSSATDAETGDVTLFWNRNMAFTDSFEDYPDFATGRFGDWISLDLDEHIVYPISLGGSIIWFPGASTPDAPNALAPIVFNASKTIPSMLPTDAAMTAPTGDKQILFFSPQQNGANKWLISPVIDVMDDYLLRVTAKSYTNLYPESLEFAVSTDLDGDPTTMTVLTTASRMPADQWMMYETDLNEYAGQKVRVGIHYVSYDTFFAQLDDFYVGNGQEAGEDIDAGNVIEYSVYTDGTLYATTAETSIAVTGLSAGDHILGVQARYKTGMSGISEITVHVDSSGILTVDTTPAASEWYRIDGTKVGRPTEPGIYIEHRGRSTRKVVIR